MRNTAGVFVALVMSSSLLGAQEERRVPKDSVRVVIPGCTRGSVFTAGPRTQHEPGNVDIPDGMHLRMFGPKKVLAEIKAHEGSMVEIAGIMKKGQRRPEGIGIGRGIRIVPGVAPPGGSTPPMPMPILIAIDVEGWRPLADACRSR